MRQSFHDSALEILLRKLPECRLRLFETAGLTSNKSCNYPPVSSDASSSCCSLSLGRAGIARRITIVLHPFMSRSCKADVYSCENAADYDFNVIGIKATSGGTQRALRWDLGGKNGADEVDLTHRSSLPYITLPFPAWR